MKMFALAATGLLALAGTAAPAAAQRTVVERTVVHRGPAHRVAHTRRVCHFETRHHHRARVCRTVRYR